MKETAQRPPAKWQPILVAVLLALATGWAFAGVLDCDFVNFDDDLYVTNNPPLTLGFSGAGLRWAWTTTQSVYWHPVTWTSLLLDYQFYGLQPWGYHLTNLLFHAVNAVLLFWVLWQLTGAFWPSVAVAALFALHPLRVESVAWVTERKDLLSMFFALLTLWSYLGYARRPSLLRYLLVLMLFVLGLFSKPVLVTLPCLLLLLDFWPLRRIAGQAQVEDGQHLPGRKVRWLVLEKAPLLAIAVGVGLVTCQMARDFGATDGWVPQSLEGRLGNGVVAYCQYLGMTFYPVNLSVFYPFPSPPWSWLTVGCAALALLALSAAAVCQARRRPYLLVGWFWFLGTMFPMLNVIPTGAQALADRFTYLPQVGLLVALVWWFHEEWAHWQVRRGLAWGLGLGVLLVCGLLTRQQVSTWRDSQALWEHALGTNPENYLAHNNLGNIYFQQGDRPRGLHHLREGVRLFPGCAYCQYNLGHALGQMGDWAGAEEHFRITLASGFLQARAHEGLGLVLWQRGEQAAALDHVTAAWRINPRLPDANDILGQAFLDQGFPERAAEHFQVALQGKPDWPDLHANLAAAFYSQGKLEEAIRHLRKALELRPDYAIGHNQLAQVLQRTRDYDGARAHCREAIRFDPKMADAHNNLGIALESLGQTKDALGSLRRAVELRPEFIKYRCDLARAHFAAGDLDAARAEYQRASELGPSWPAVAATAACDLLRAEDPKQRQPELAVRLAEQVAQSTELRDVAYLEILAEAYIAAGATDQAKSVLRRALALLADGDDARKLQRMLEALTPSPK